MEIIGIDCEMVFGEPKRYRKKNSIVLARVSIVNQEGVCIYDKYVKPTVRVVDYNTEFSGIRKEDLVNGENLDVVRAEVATLMKGRLLVGHALINDFHALDLKHPEEHTRDTQKYPFFQEVMDHRMPSLQALCKHFLGISVQKGEHNSIEDAKAAVDLYKMHRENWEKWLTDGNSRNRGARRV